MNLQAVLFTLPFAVALSGCNLIQSKEEQCLQSSRMQFKDPDSGKVIQNLGDRGHRNSKLEGIFWIRYSATNSYGARVSSNMACSKSGGSWVRAEAFELSTAMLASLELQKQKFETSSAKLRADIDALTACKTQACKLALTTPSDLLQPDPIAKGRRIEAEADEEIKRLIFEDVISLNKLD